MQVRNDVGSGFDRAVEGGRTNRLGRILLVEPDNDTRLLYRTAFEMAGHEVVEAADGRDGLVKALIHPPSLVITETRLPLMDGFSLCEILRRDPVTRLLPILIVTAEPESQTEQQARAVGANAVLAKPSRLDSILDEVRRLIDSKSTDDGHAPSAPIAVQTGDGNLRGRVRATRSRMHARFDTTTPPVSPPDLHCPSCDSVLAYRYSHIGGVSSRHSEQWDYYACTACPCAFEYRQRTKRLRRVDEAVAQLR